MKVRDKNNNKNKKIRHVIKAMTSTKEFKDIVEVKMRIVNFNLKFIMTVKLITNLYE
jgi:hypothetical protein